MITKNIFRKSLLLAVLLTIAAIPGWAQLHDLVMQSAPDIDSLIIANCKSPDIQVGAPFGSGSATTTILHGRTNKLYARFRVNGILDPTITDAAPVQIEFYYRQAVAGETPPAAADASWNYIGEITADGEYETSGLYLALGGTWPDDYPAAANLCLDWTAPETGNFYHIRAVAVYTGGTTDDAPDNNTALSLYEAITKPHDIEVVLVHDVSGSMLYTYYDGIPYIDHAKQRAQAFIAYMNENDKAAVVAYGGCLPGGVDQIWPAAGLASMTIGNKITAINEIAAQVTVPSTSCLTPMGDGIQAAINILTASGSTDPEVKKMILLLTDGFENSGTLRACSWSAVPPCASSGILTSLQANHIQVYSVALGTTSWSDCIDCLATNSGGQWFSALSPGVELTEVYLDMQQAYEDDDLYRKNITTIGAGSDSYQVYFEGVDDTLYFILSWDNLNAELKFDLTSPSGNKFKVTAFRNRGYTVYQVSNPEKGFWKYDVSGPTGEKYIAAVRSDRVGVRLNLSVESGRLAGSSFKINAKLTGISPKDAKVTATVSFPAKVSVDTGISSMVRDYILNNKILPLNADDIKKYPDYNQNGIFLTKVYNNRVNPLELFPVGTATVPLTLNADGTFTGSFAGNPAAGKYTVTINANGKQFDRAYSQSVLLKPDKPGIERSYADVLFLNTRIPGTRQFVVKIYCNDKYGNLVTAPDLQKRISFKFSGCEAEGKLEAAFDNTFHQLVNTGLDQKFDVTVLLDGKPLTVKYY